VTNHLSALDYNFFTLFQAYTDTNVFLLD